MPSHSQDDAFHEIQLNGKQLVFLFMAATVVSVVIFLCGVLVGRGVRAERGGTVADASSLAPDVDTTPLEPAPPAGTATPAAAGSDPTAAPPPPAGDDLSYFNRLEQSKEPVEELKAPEKPAAAPAERTAAPPVRQTPRPPAATETAAAPASEGAATALAVPPGQGYAVQIAALNVRSEADAIAKKLASKGYAAYVLPPATGTPQVFRVRIGKFNSRREAESMAAKLQREEQFKPWVTR